MRFRMPLMLRQGIVGCAATKFQALVHDPAGGLANDDKAHDDRLLSSLVGKEVPLGHALGKAARIVRGRAHLIETTAAAGEAWPQAATFS